MNYDFRGAGVALITPFKNNLEVDFDALGVVIENQIAGGMDYLVALGTTAETPTLSESEQKEILQFVRAKTAGRIPVVAGLGGNDTLGMLKKLEKLDYEGLSGLLVVTPYYNRPGQEGLFRHYKELADHSPLPIILYNVPSRTGINLEAETVIRLAAASDKIVAVKEASGIIPQITKIALMTPPSFRVISGDDVMALPIISVGGEGVISVIANALPKQLSTLIHKALSGDFAGALEVHFALSELFRLQFLEGNPAGVKAMMHYQGIISNVLRLPLLQVTPETYQKTVAELQRIS